MVAQMLSILRNSSLVVLILVLLTPNVLAAIGQVTDQEGPNALLERNKEKLEAGKGTSVEMNDIISTAKTKLAVTFEDDTKVAVTEQSRLIIDDFVYDPNSKTGKLAMEVAMGTVRYASGNIAKNSRQNVRVRTPAATVSVRGTDFAMVVNEIGQSMVTLLPSCPDFGLIENKDDENKCPVGEIMVSTDAGYVIMNQAYQTTIVASSFQLPTKPRVLTDKPSLNNLLIIAPPAQFPKGFNTSEEDLQQVTFLDVDVLEFDELMKDLLADNSLEQNDLDQNELEGEYLDDLLLMGIMPGLGDALKERDGVLPTLPDYPWVKGYYNEQEINLKSERPPHIAEIKSPRDVDGNVIITQDGILADIQQNGGSDVTITIIQSQ
jgi:hypothetical protein